MRIYKNSIFLKKFQQNLNNIFQDIITFHKTIQIPHIIELTKNDEMCQVKYRKMNLLHLAWFYYSVLSRLQKVAAHCYCNKLFDIEYNYKLDLIKSFLL